jgi:hypothetical protein
MARSSSLFLFFVFAALLFFAGLPSSRAEPDVDPSINNTSTDFAPWPHCKIR